MGVFSTENFHMLFNVWVLFSGMLKLCNISGELGTYLYTNGQAGEHSRANILE